MPTCVYLVIKSLGSWWVDCEGESYGPCETYDEAVEAAHELIGHFHDPGRRAEIWAPDETGKMHMIWSREPATPNCSVL